MKRHAFTTGIVLFFILMLLCPKEVFNGASAGLLLWFDTVLPTLLPSIIISNLLISSNAISYISRILGPFLCRVFGISPHGSFAVLSGFLCGYPMGAKVTADLIQSGYISRSEGKYLLSFCNNTSPMFIVSYVIWQNLKSEELMLPAVCILFLAPVACSFLFRLYYRTELAQARSSFRISPGAASQSAVRTDFRIVDAAIMNGFETITKVGGYIILFSVILTLLQRIPFRHPLWNHIVLPMIEITNGVPLICTEVADVSLRFLYTLALTTFGGFCSVAQTKCMVQDAGLPIGPYIIEKLITALVTSLFVLLFFH